MNLAARIAAQAEGGEVLASDVVRQLVAAMVAAASVALAAGGWYARRRWLR